MSSLILCTDFLSKDFGWFEREYTMKSCLEQFITRLIITCGELQHITQLKVTVALEKV
jgi:hypothetical protein